MVSMNVTIYKKGFGESFNKAMYGMAKSCHRFCFRKNTANFGPPLIAALCFSEHMSTRRKKNSHRPGNSKKRVRPVSLAKRVVVCCFGIFFVWVILSSLTTSNLDSLPWWNFVIMGIMFLAGLFLIVIAVIPRHREVAMTHDHLVEGALRAIFRQLLNRLF